jgi:putative membrane protein
MNRHSWMAALVTAALGMASLAAAQTAGGGGGGTGTASTSPGIGRQGESETGVGIPADAPVDNRTLKPVQIGTGEAGRSSRAASNAGPGAGSTAYTDLSQDNTGTGSAATSSAAKTSSDLRDGLEKLHAADQAEIQAGQLAQQNGSSSDVKAFGQQMVSDHTQNDQQLSGMAQTLGVNLEGDAYQKQMKDARKMASSFEGKSGTDFDQAYTKAMVKDHEKAAKDVKKLADQARKDGQGELASFLDQTVQTIESHLSMAKQIQSSVKSASKASSSATGTGSSAKAQ